MKVYIFGNRDYSPDAGVFGIVDEIKKVLREFDASPVARSAQDDELAMKSLLGLAIMFVEVKPNEDVPFGDEEEVVIMDTVMGIEEVSLLTEKDLEKLELPPRTSAHEFDLGFQLRYLRKLGKLKKVWIVGLPMGKKVEVGKVAEVLARLG